MEYLSATPWHISAYQYVMQKAVSTQIGSPVFAEGIESVNLRKHTFLCLRQKPKGKPFLSLFS